MMPTQSTLLHRMPSTAVQLDTEFKRGLGLYASTMVVVGSMIGSGIFLVSAEMGRQTGSPGLLLTAWVLTGVLTLAAALSYGELAAMMPRAGGQYVYLREAFSPLWGFLYGWTLFMVIQTGTIAAVAVGFARYTGYLLPWFAEDHYLDRADSPLVRLRGLALDGAAARHRAHRAADLDEHARARLGQADSERLHDDEDRRAHRAHRRRPARRMESAGGERATSATCGRRAARCRSRRASTRRPTYGMLHRAVRRAGRLALFRRRLEQHHLHGRRSQGAAAQHSARARPRHGDRHHAVSARQRRLSRHAPLRGDSAGPIRPRRHGHARSDLPGSGRDDHGDRDHDLDVRLQQRTDPGRARAPTTRWGATASSSSAPARSTSTRCRRGDCCCRASGRPC